jgi:ABC-type lipoprotein export system ATPase subunit
MSALENVALPAWKLSGSRRDAESRAAELLERFGLGARRDARARVLSVGEAQRTAIARAMINRPRVILADEPTGALDSTSSSAVLEALLGACQEGAAMLLVTHDLGVAARATRSIAMRDGLLVQCATAQRA